MEKEQVISILEALAVGDSFGKCTEFASRKQICLSFHTIDRILQPEESLSHRDMRYAQVTDDTEQNFFLIADYAREGKISAEIAAGSILRWYTESPEPDKYIGPSSLKAIKAIQAGESIETAGKSGTSCGGIMRVPAAFLCSSTLSQLQDNVWATLLPTHNTVLAMEAAMGYAYALWEMRETDEITKITSAVKRGCAYVKKRYGKAAESVCAPDSVQRIDHLLSVWPAFRSQDDLLDFLFYVYGTTISSCDVFVAAFALFLWAGEDVFLSIKMAAMLGGDTDTIACLAAVLCCMYAKGHNIPQDIVKAVKDRNNINFANMADCVINVSKKG